LLDLSISLKCVVSQRLVRGVDGKRLPAVEVLMNTTHIAELIKDARIDEIKEAMEKSMSPGSQTFEQALFQMYSSGKISLDEAMANSDSTTHLSWLINKATPSAEEQAEKEAAAPQGDNSFAGFTLSSEMLDKA